ncbi:Uncharacterised protein [Segatella copri]|nr:Uncharacterised protein [Segatella copri]
MLCQQLHIWLHIIQKFRLTNTADSRILVEHADIIQVVDFTKDT